MKWSSHNTVVFQFLTFKREILYEKLCMKLYLSDEITHVNGTCPHIGILLGLDSNDRDRCDKL